MRRSQRSTRDRGDIRSTEQSDQADDDERKWEASVARRLPCRWNPLLLPGGVRPRFCPCNVRPLGRQLRGNCERLVIVGTCVMSRRGGLIPIGNQVFTALVDPISPPSAAA